MSLAVARPSSSGAPKVVTRTSYQWLAVRCLSCPDNVLHCESVHAQFQWITAVAHGIKPMIELMPAKDINAALTKVRNNTARYRVVVEFPQRPKGADASAST